MKTWFYGIKNDCCKLESNLELYENRLSDGDLYQCKVCKRLHRRVIS